MTEVEANIDVLSKEGKNVETTVEVEEKTVEVNGHTNGEVVAEEAPTKASSEGNGQVKKEEDDDSSEPKGADVAATEAQDATAIEEQKEETPPSPPKVILHQLPPGRFVPSMSLFCLKLETYLRLNTIPYENHYGYKVGKKGKFPWIEYKGERKTDTGLIIPFLNETFELNLDSDLTPEQLAIGRAVKTMIEENTYWANVYSSFVDNFNEFKKVVAPESGAGIGFSVSMKMNQRKARSQLDGHGMGRHSREEIYDIAQKDIQAVSTLLGEKDFLFGDKPTTFDCTLFGFFATVLWGGVESPLIAYIKDNASNLVSHSERMKELCWHDWSDMVLGERPEPQLKKGFSFRKGKKKSKPVKEASAEQDEETKEEVEAGGEAETATDDKPEACESEENKAAENEENKAAENEGTEEDKKESSEEEAKTTDEPTVAETEQKTTETESTEATPAENNDTTEEQ